MGPNNNLPNDPEWAKLVGLDSKQIRSIFPVEPLQWIQIETSRQVLSLHRHGEITQVWPISTAKAGLNGMVNSYGTPGGLHRIRKKIGAEMETGMVFESRLATGEIWDLESGNTKSQANLLDKDLILTRILTLEGLEEGLNRGFGCDSLERYIYIHGTNHENLIGQPVSHGCIRMTNAHVIELFEKVGEGDPVVIS